MEEHQNEIRTPKENLLIFTVGMQEDGWHLEVRNRHKTDSMPVSDMIRILNELENQKHT